MTDNTKDNIQDILSNIRDVISGNNEEVLELVNEVDKDGNPIKEPGILQKIDDTLGTSGNTTENAGNTPDAVQTSTSTHVTEVVDTSSNPNESHEQSDKLDAPVEAENKIEEQSPQIVPEVQSVQSSQQSQPISVASDRNQSTKGLLSEQAIEESSRHFKELLKAVARPHDNFGLRSGVTVEDLVVEALKPQLSSWLDKNLPILVKELVEKEIKRLIPHDE